MKKRIFVFLMTFALLIGIAPIFPAYAITVNHENPIYNDLYAIQGTPEIDGVMTLGEWDDAYVLTAPAIYKDAGTLWTGAYLAYYLMWDEDYLYFLQYAPYSDLSKNQSIGVNVLVTSGEQSQNRWKNFALTDTSSEDCNKQTGITADGFGYFIEMRLAWSWLAQGTSFTPAEDSTVQIRFKPAVEGRQGFITSDQNFYHTIVLTGAGNNPTAGYIEPCFSWYTKDSKEYILEDEADLIGFTLLSGSNILDFQYFKNLAGKSPDGWSRTNNFCNGVTVKLANDMDLNPGWKADGTGTKTFANPIWAIPFYNSTFDGQGHTIKGINPMQYSRQPGEIGFFAWISNASTVKNLTLDNGVVIPVGSFDATYDARSVGGLVGCVQTDKQEVTVTFDNISANLIVKGRESNDAYVGGIIGSVYSGSGLTNIKMTDCSFAGNVFGIEGTKVGTLAGRISFKTFVVSEATDCSYVGTQTDVAKYGYGTATEITTETVKVIGYSIYSASVPKIRFYAVNTLENNGGKTYLTVANGTPVEVQGVPYTGEGPDGKVFTAKDRVYVYSIDVLAKQITDAVVLTVKDAQGNAVAVQNTTTHTVEEYCEVLVNIYNQSMAAGTAVDEQKKVAEICTALQFYGYTAQMADGYPNVEDAGKDIHIDRAILESLTSKIQ